MAEFSDIMRIGESEAFQNDIGMCVRNATLESLAEPCTATNRAVCDMITRNNDRSSCEKAVVAFIWRLKSSCEHVVYLSLVLLGECIKACGERFAGAVNKVLMDEIVYIAIAHSKGERAETVARDLIQTWGLRYRNSRVNGIFFETYRNLTMKGVEFPSDPSVRDNLQFLKLEQDVNYVEQKLRLLEQLVNAGESVFNDDSLFLTFPPDSIPPENGLLHFLTSCMEKLQEVIQVGCLGLVPESLLAKCIRVHDQLQAVLNKLS